MRRILVIANQTLGGAHLLEAVQDCVRDGDSEFYVLVPATPVADQVLQLEGDAESIASRRLEACLAGLRARGIAATGTVGDADALHAAQDLLAHEHFDEIIVSTLPVGLSRWLGSGLAQRLARSTELPVRSITAGGGDLPARVGDTIVVALGTTRDERRGTVLEVRGDPLRPHYVIGWESGRSSLYFPDQDPGE